MPVDVIMPKVDMVMDEGTVAHWHKAEGDQVKAGEPLFDIETDKATMEVEAPASGTLVRVTAPDGMTVPVATVIAMILEKGETLQATAAPAPRQPLPEAPASAPASQLAEVDSILVATTGDSRPRATPLARRMAREHGLDLAALSGGGPQGRLRKQDVLQAIETLRAAAPRPQNDSHAVVAPPALATSGAANNSAPAQSANAVPSPTVAAPVPAVSTLPNSAPSTGTEQADGKLVPLTGIRRIIAQRLTVSASIPQFVLSMDVDLSAALQLRERLSYRPSVTAILARVVAAVLPRHPSLNASFREDGIWLHTPVHLGIAMDSGGDLLVPVIRNAHQRTLSEIATTLGDIRQRAEAKQLPPSELQGSTFSISNLGMFGIDQFTALINPPEAAILAVGRTNQRPFEINGSIVFKPILTLTLSADHRVTDGATAARFLQEVRTVLEEPLLLI